MIFYIANPKKVDWKTPELKNEFSKVAGQKINTQNYISVVFIYNRHVQSKNKNKKAITFNIASK